MLKTKRLNSISTVLTAFAAVIAACFALMLFKAEPVAYANASAEYTAEEMAATFDFCDALSEIAELIGSALEEGDEQGLSIEAEETDGIFAVSRETAA